MTITTQLIGKLGGGLDWQSAQENYFQAEDPTLLSVTGRTQGTILTIRDSSAVGTKAVYGKSYFLLRRGDSVNGLRNALEAKILYLD